MTPELTRPIALDAIGTAPRQIHVEADTDERAALAKRFDLTALDRLDADATLVARAGGVDVTGRLRAAVVQADVISGEPVPATIDQAFVLHFVKDAALSVEEVELGADDLDIMPHDGVRIDLGEAVAQTLGLALDPFPRVSIDDDDERIWSAGPQGGAFAGLGALLGSKS